MILTIRFMVSLEPLIAYWLHIILIANYSHTSGINNGKMDISVSFVYEINKQKHSRAQYTLCYGHQCGYVVSDRRSALKSSNVNNILLCLKKVNLKWTGNVIMYDCDVCNPSVLKTYINIERSDVCMACYMLLECKCIYHCDVFECVMQWK